MNTPIPPNVPEGKQVPVEQQQFHDKQEAAALYAIISIKPDGTEGMCSFEHEGTVYPCVTERWDHVDHLRPHARRMAKSKDAKAGNVRFVLRKFSDATDIEEFMP